MIGALLIPVVSVIAIAVISRRSPTKTLRWTSRRATALANPCARDACRFADVGSRVLSYDASIVIVIPADAACQTGLAALGPVGLFTHACRCDGGAFAQTGGQTVGLGVAGCLLCTRCLDRVRDGDDASGRRPASTRSHAAVGVRDACGLYGPDHGGAFHARNLAQWRRFVRTRPAGRSERCGCSWPPTYSWASSSRPKSFRVGGR